MRFFLFVMGVGAQCFIIDESDMLSFGFRWCVTRLSRNLMHSFGFWWWWCGG